MSQLYNLAATLYLVIIECLPDRKESVVRFAEAMSDEHPEGSSLPLSNSQIQRAREAITVLSSLPLNGRSTGESCMMLQ